MSRVSTSSSGPVMTSVQAALIDVFLQCWFFLVLEPQNFVVWFRPSNSGKFLSRQKTARRAEIRVKSVDGLVCKLLFASLAV